jgi:hypothetical protein
LRCRRYLHHRVPRSFGDAKKAKVKKPPRADRVRRAGAENHVGLTAIHKFNWALYRATKQDGIIDKTNSDCQGRLQGTFIFK